MLTERVREKRLADADGPDDGEVRVRIDKDLEDLIAQNPDLF